MKKIYALILGLALLIIMPLSALADDASPSPSPTDTQPVTAASLAIDNANIYEGMDKAYKDGYTPSVSNGVATVILPLIASGTIDGNVITATPGLGDPSTSPFVYKNYQKTVALNNNTVSGGAVVASYLVRFDLPLVSGRINGVHSLTIDIQAKGSDGSTIDQSFTEYVTITDGKDPNAAAATPAPVHPPKIIVSGYSVNPTPAVAGEEFTATITLENTSTTMAVYDTAVTITCDSQNFSLQNGSGTIYVGKIAKGGTADIEIDYKTDLDTPPQRYNISLAIAYDDSNATALSSTETIQAEVNQPMNVVLDKPTIPESVNAGDTMSLAFQVMNMGRGKVYNVRIDLSAPGLVPSATAFIGNMEAGTAATGNMDVFVGTKDMTEGYTGTDKYGETSGKLTLIYEDEAGKQYTQDTYISTTINEPVIPVTNTDQNQKPETASQWWISVVIGIVVIAALAILIVHSRKKRNRNEDI